MEASRDSSAFGMLMSCVGDINQDSFDDVWIPDLFWDDPERGFIYSGADQSILCTLVAETPAGYLRGAVCADFNGDTYEDLIFTDPRHDGVSDSGGCAYIVYGSGSGLPAMINGSSADATIDGFQLGGLFGAGVVVLNDVNGDSHPDFAVAASEAFMGGPGHVYVFSGYTLDTLYSVAGMGTGARFGWDLANSGDVNNDGYDDLLIGSSEGDSGPGYALVVSGVDGAVLYQLDGETIGDRFSYYGLSGAGDLNQDGYADVIVGAYANQAGGGQWAGRAYVFFGGSGPFPETISAADADYIITGTNQSCLGFGVGGIDDINGDGSPEFVTGAMYYRHPTPGQLHVYSGADASLMFVLEGLESYEDFGATCLAPWDLDSDGVKDLLVGAYGQSDYINGGAARGRVYSYLIGDLDDDQVMAQCDNCNTDTNPGQENFDTDTYGDVCDICPRYATPGDVGFTTGDINQNGVINTQDIILMVNFIFKSGLPPVPIPEAGDVNFDDDHKVTSADIIYEVNHVFKSGPAPLDACVL